MRLERLFSPKAVLFSYRLTLYRDRMLTCVSSARRIALLKVRTDPLHMLALD